MPKIWRLLILIIIVSHYLENKISLNRRRAACPPHSQFITPVMVSLAERMPCQLDQLHTANQN